MGCKPRIPEGRTVDSSALEVFSRVASWTGRVAAWRVKNILGSTLGLNKRALDIGTGPGAIPLCLRRIYPGVSFVGLDVSPEMLNIAKGYTRGQEENIVLLAGDGELLPFEDNSFDGVMSFFSLHHMDNPANLLKEVNRVLRPGGILLIIDFRRDMPSVLFVLLNLLWQMGFMLTQGRTGLRDSIRSAWCPGEIEEILKNNDIGRFRVRSNPMELWIIQEEE